MVGRREKANGKALLVTGTNCRQIVYLSVNKRGCPFTWDPLHLTKTSQLLLLSILIDSCLPRTKVEGGGASGIAGIFVIAKLEIFGLDSLRQCVVN